MSDQILSHGLLINKRGIQLADLPICDFEIQTETIEKSQIKLMFSTKRLDSFLLKNHIDPSVINSEHDNWIFDTVFNENFLPENLPVYIGILCSRAELVFENKKIKPSDELNNAMKQALKHNNPYHEIINVFKDYGYFLPKKVILGHKLYRITYLIAREDSPLEPHFLRSEWTHFNDSTLFEHNDILDQWEDLIKLHNFDTSFLTSINGEDVMKDRLKDWAASCLKSDLNSLQIISWEKLYPLYEIFDEPLNKEIKFILGSDDQTKKFGVKERVLLAGEIPIKNSTYHYRVKYSDHLNSSNYKIFGKLVTQDYKQINVAIKFQSMNRFGFTIIIENLDLAEHTDLKIIWILIGLPSEIGFYSPNTRNINVSALDSCSFAYDKILSLQVPKNLPINSIMCTNLTYPPSDKANFKVKIQTYCDNKVNILIKKDIKNIYYDKNEGGISKGNQDAQYLLQWCIIFFPENDKININSDSIGASICLNAIGQPIYTAPEEDL
ncbi:13721_t:CDS:2, partial [Dentiscutata heterogama]